jgi:hypothetical protein
MSSVLIVRPGPYYIHVKKKKFFFLKKDYMIFFNVYIVWTRTDN